MAAPERFAEKSDLPLQRGHRPYMAQGAVGPTTSKKRDAVAISGTRCPKVTQRHLPKVTERMQRASHGGAVLKLSPLLFTINEPGLALTSLVDGTPMTFRSLSTHRLPGEPANPPLILIR